MKVWLGCRMLDLLGAAKHYKSDVKLSVEITSVNPDPGADTQAIPR